MKDNEINVSFEGSMNEAIYVVIYLFIFFFFFFFNVQAKTADIRCENMCKTTTHKKTKNCFLRPIIAILQYFRPSLSYH